MVCIICESPAVNEVGSVQGYRQNTHYAVLVCSDCEASFVRPGATDDRLYEAIYRNVARVPGYARYALLADELLRSRDPISHIASADECYYAIVKLLQARFPDKSGLRICEVGCGQGYLTYALTRAGYDSIGVDISSEAIDLARRRYGNHYFCGNIEQFVKSNDRLNVILATELIEHLESPVVFARSMLAALKKGGCLILTTPNKLPGGKQIWDTELPPVHLSWLSKASMQSLAARVDCSVEFVDFTQFYESGDRYQVTNASALQRTPVFNEQYELIQFAPEPGLGSWMRRAVKQTLPRAVTRTLQRARSGQSYRSFNNEASITIGAVFTPRV
jgi:2-polyprenyl-3-methyl-5-hydroxy-6-metoxy-1,4-benzoquinol methylase